MQTCNLTREITAHDTTNYCAVHKEDLKSDIHHAYE